MEQQQAAGAQLAKAFTVIAKTSEVAESKSAAVIRIVRASNIKDEATFSECVKQAYEAKGWNPTAGKPAKGSKLKPVPNTVKVCVSQVRAAFRLKLAVGGFKTFHALRVAIREKRKARSARHEDPRLMAVHITNEGKLIDAPFHDAVALFKMMPASRAKEEFAREQAKLVQRFRVTLADLPKAA